MNTYCKRRDSLIDALQKPIDFASKDNYAGVDKLKAIDSLVTALVQKAELLEEDFSDLKSNEVSTVFKTIVPLLKKFDSLGTAKKIEQISKATLILKTISPSAAFPIKISAEAATNSLTVNIDELKKPVQFVKGVGPKLAAVLNKKGIFTVEDLLYFTPIRYEDRSRHQKIRELKAGEPATVVATVMAAGQARYGRRRVFEIMVTDSTGHLKLKWFNFKAAYMNRFVIGKSYSIYGTLSVWGKSVEMIHPDLELYEEGEEKEPKESSSGLVPVYSQIERLHQKSIRKIVSGAVDLFANAAVSAVPVAVSKKLGLVDLPAAFRVLHLPGTEGENAVRRAKKSLAFDELFMLELGLALKRQGAKKAAGLQLSIDSQKAQKLEKAFRKNLPFKLTGAQERVLAEIKEDMSAPYPMNRLLQGDVGSGKTVVCLVAALGAVGAGFQAAIMAPTEILAEQHLVVIKKYTDSLGIKTALLTSGVPKKEKERLIDSIAEGSVDIVVGTHALIQKGVKFNNLALAVIDEQHRFGVVQRAELMKKGVVTVDGSILPPDMLIMTATPIPRTLTMTIFSDLEVSIIDELPPGRQPVTTTIMREKERGKAYSVIREELKKGAQGYVVCPLVEESEELSLLDATRTKETLASDVFADFTVGLIHGRMKSTEKESIMRSFKAGAIDLLVATTVIEVGVDVPNATVMLIEHAERFGLSQLHQLRGRVGRGSGKSVCILLAQWTNSEDTLRRLRVMEATEDGFKIAEEDLAIRGPGDFIGTRQSGLPEFRFCASLGDLPLLKSARDEAAAYLATDPQLETPHSAIVKEVLSARWKERLELIEIG